MYLFADIKIWIKNPLYLLKNKNHI
jgi:hypothetical protein